MFACQKGPPQGRRGSTGSLFWANRCPGRFPATIPLRRTPIVVLGMALIFLLVAGPVACQLELPSPGQERAASEAMGASVDRIIYVSPQGDLFTVGPDGSGSQRLTGGTNLDAGPTGPFQAQSLDFASYYAWPTWSPDGTKLAASLVQVDGRRATGVSVQVLEATTGRATTIYENDVPALIADGVPHYLYWSPDSKSLAFIASTPQGLTLFVDDSEVDSNPVAAERGAPLYFSWSGFSNSLVLHSGRDVKLLQRPFDAASVTLLAQGDGFRAPAFSPDGRRLAYSVGTESGTSLLMAPGSDVESTRTLAELGVFSAFMWSPDGSRLAVAEQPDAASFLFQSLRVLSADGSEVQTVVQEPLLAFYWSPQGDKIAWVAVDAQERLFEWKVASADGSGMRPLLRFQPSSEIFTMFTFFDQYAYSHSPWSPDGSRLVGVGSRDVSVGGSDGQSPSGSRIYVLDATGTEQPRDIGPGTLAFWSWN